MKEFRRRISATNQPNISHQNDDDWPKHHQWATPKHADMSHKKGRALNFCMTV